jgi:hypothetical protein
MTNLEYIKSLNAEQFEKFIFETTHYMCLQRGKHANEVWRKRCRSEKYRHDGGCSECRIDWLNAELGELEAWQEGLQEETHED